jgi:hypothetical protein
LTKICGNANCDIEVIVALPRLLKVAQMKPLRWESKVTDILADIQVNAGMMLREKMDVNLSL